MNNTIEISTIVVEDRDRKDLGDISQLAEDIRDVGLINPITLAPLADGRFRLAAGGRRLAALCSLGHTLLYHGVTYDKTKPGYLFGSELDEDMLKEIELRENVSRKDYTWQEEVLNIYKIHLLRIRKATLDGASWGMRDTGRLLGMALGKVAYVAQVARKLMANDERFVNAESFMDALRLLQNDDLDALNAELARRTAQNVGLLDSIQEVPLFDGELEPATDAPTTTNTGFKIPPWINTFQIGLQYEQSLDKQKGTTYDDYLDYRVRHLVSIRANQLDAEDVVAISKFVVLADCIEHLNLLPTESFDHSITDPPYGIDMDMLNQQNPHGGMVNVDRIEEEHDVAENEDLFTKMFPAVHRVLKPNAFFVLWCDIMQWQRLYDLAIAADFKVQRWPLTWHKTHSCMNQSAQYNFTKNTEIAMVCRKGNATLVHQQPTCVISASSTDARKTFAHPFAKPPELTTFIANAISLESQLILEPFAGIGSIVLPLLGSGRRVHAVEKVPKHYNQMLESVKQFYLNLNPKSVFA